MNFETLPGFRAFYPEDCFLRNYIFILLMTNFINVSVFGEQSNCLDYPYPEGIYIRNKLWNKKQLVYTRSVTIKSKNIKLLVQGDLLLL